MTPARKDYRNRIELLQGTLDMLILQILQWGPQHGYAITADGVLVEEISPWYPFLKGDLSGAVILNQEGRRGDAQRLSVEQSIYVIASIYVREGKDAPRKPIG